MRTKRTIWSGFLGLVGLLSAGCVEENASVGSGGSNTDMAVMADGASGSADGGLSGDGAVVMDLAVAPDAVADAAMIDCTSFCDRFIDCAESLCPEGNPIVLRAACRMDCADRPSLMDGAEGLMCGELVERLANEVPAIGSRCEAAPVPLNPACAEYAEVASARLTEQCPNAETLGPGSQNLFASLCSAALANGDFEVSQLAGVAEAGCNNLLVSSVIGYFLAVDGPEGSGGLLPLCQDGPLSEPETCDAACNKLNECIPEGTPEEEGGGLRDYPACRLLCGASDAIAPETWTCVSSQDTCGDAFACFQEPQLEPVDACIGFAAVVDGCIAQSCAESAVISVGIRTALTSLCSDVVRSEAFTEAQVAAARDAGACDDELTQRFTDYMLTVNPMQMGSGQLAGLCAGNPANPFETCQRACPGLIECVPEDNPLRRDGICEYFCMVNESEDAIESRTWNCLAEADGCGPVGACFDD